MILMTSECKRTDWWLIVVSSVKILTHQVKVLITKQTGV
jgi:hypothetical protein